MSAATTARAAQEADPNKMYPPHHELDDPVAYSTRQNYDAPFQSQTRPPKQTRADEKYR